MNSPERARFEAALANPSAIKLAEEREGYRDLYVFALGPGQVRYLNAFDFFGADVDSLIQFLRAGSTAVEILFVPDRISHPDTYGVTFETRDVDSVLRHSDWEYRLRVHHGLGRVLMQYEMPTAAYVLFHRHLELGQEFAVAECSEAWVRDSSTDGALANSYRSSPEHLFVFARPNDFAVFKRTPFVRARLEIIADSEHQRIIQDEAKVAAAESERLRRSRFTTFVYIMEDTRKAVFKIGRSRTPGKREKTLQSEVPETKLRFSIPGEEVHEKQLQARFTHRRVRGEWFELTEKDLLEAVTFLKANCDVSRAQADYNWLGALYLRAV